MSITATNPITQILAVVLFIVPFPIALNAQLEMSHLEPSGPLGGRGKAAPYIPQPGHLPSRQIVPATSQAVQPRPALPAVAVKDGPSEWISEAIHYYPELAIKDSALNKAFLLVYQQTKESRPELLSKPYWPLGIAIAAKTLLDRDTLPQVSATQPSKQAPDEAVVPGLPERRAAEHILRVVKDVPQPTVPNTAITSTSGPQIGAVDPASQADIPLTPASTPPTVEPGDDASVQNRPETPQRDNSYVAEQQSNETQHILDPQDVMDASKYVYERSLSQDNVHVGGYVRDGTYVAPYERRPPGGYTIDQHIDAAQNAVIVACGAVAIDWLYGKYQEYSKKHEQEQAQNQSK